MWEQPDIGNINLAPIPKYRLFGERSMKRSRLSGAVCACLLLLCFQSAHAVVIDDVIYDNGVLVSDIDVAISSATITGTPEIVRQIADDFILDSGSTWSVTDVHWLGWDIENDPTSTFNIYFYADNGGKPTGGGGRPLGNRNCNA